MFTRRLRCLVLNSGRVVEIAVDAREAIVTLVQLALHARLRCAATAIELELFLAQDAQREWLTSAHKDAVALVSIGNEINNGDQDSTQDDVHALYLSESNRLWPTDTLVTYFPRQPALQQNGAAAVHVLVRIPEQAASLSELICADTESFTRRLVESMQDACSDSVAPLAMARLKRDVLLRKPVRLQSLRRSGDTVMWPCERARASVYVPPAWTLLRRELLHWLDEIRGHGRRAYVHGPQGVGKSAFLGVVLYQLLGCPRAPVIVLDVPGLTFARIDSAQNVVEGARGLDFADELQADDTFYLFDATHGDSTAPLEPPRCLARSVIVVSEESRQRSRPLHEMAVSRFESFYLPMWTQEDVRYARRLCYAELDPPAVMALYYKWGGLPGRVLVHDLVASEQRLLAALPAVTDVHVTQMLANLKYNRPDTSALHIDQALSSLVMRSGSVRTAFRVGHLHFCSQYVCDAAIARMPIPTKYLMLFETESDTTLWRQVRKSVVYLQQEEEEKHASA